MLAEEGGVVAEPDGEASRLDTVVGMFLAGEHTEVVTGAGVGAMRRIDVL
jgi:hypothetical protein